VGSRLQILLPPNNRPILGGLLRNMLKLSGLSMALNLRFLLPVIVRYLFFQHWQQSSRIKIMQERQSPGSAASSLESRDMCPPWRNLMKSHRTPSGRRFRNASATQRILFLSSTSSPMSKPIPEALTGQ
jgi:hypothetical protein